MSLGSRQDQLHTLREVMCEGTSLFLSTDVHGYGSNAWLEVALIDAHAHMAAKLMWLWLAAEVHVFKEDDEVPPSWMLESLAKGAEELKAECVNLGGMSPLRELYSLIEMYLSQCREGADEMLKDLRFVVAKHLDIHPAAVSAVEVGWTLGELEAEVTFYLHGREFTILTLSHYSAGFTTYEGHSGKRERPEDLMGFVAIELAAELGREPCLPERNLDLCEEGNTLRVMSTLAGLDQEVTSWHGHGTINPLLTNVLYDALEVMEEGRLVLTSTFAPVITLEITVDQARQYLGEEKGD